MGQPYVPAPADGWTAGASFLEWKRDRMELVVSILDPTPREIDAASRGKLRLGVASQRSAVLLGWNLPRLADVSMVAPCNVLVHPPEERPDLTPLPTGRRDSLTFVLVDSRDGAIQSVRVVSPSARVSRALRAAVLQHIDIGPDPKNHDGDVALARLSLVVIDRAEDGE